MVIPVRSSVAVMVLPKSVVPVSVSEISGVEWHINKRASAGEYSFSFQLVASVSQASESPAQVVADVPTLI